MNGIHHKIVIETSLENLYDAISTEQGLSNWWANASQSEDNISLSFGPNGEHKVVMKVLRNTINKEIAWQCVDGPWANKGEFIFNIEKDERGASVDFSHHGWLEIDEFYKHCNAKWGFFLAVSLKQYLELGTGLPHPNDPRI